MVHVFLYCSLTGDNTTDVSLTQEPTVIVWIIVGAVALVVLTAVLATVSLCGFLYSRKRKRTDTFDINTGMQLYIMDAVL